MLAKDEHHEKGKGCVEGISRSQDVIMFLLQSKYLYEVMPSCNPFSSNLHLPVHHIKLFIN